MKSQKYSKTIHIFALFALLGTAGFAQAVNQPKAESPLPEKNEEAVILSPFEVTSETATGYMSTNSATATRIAMKVQDLPFNVSILNKEMLRDLNVANLDATFRFINGTDNNGNPPDTGGSRMRGFQQLSGSHMRNGFRFGGIKDMFNVERIEVVRGPNSSIVGEADPGGQINIVTKKAGLGQNFGDLDLQIGSNGYFRSSLDYNVSKVVMNMPMAVRANILYYDTESFIKFAKETTKGLALVWTARPTQKTQLNLEFEYLDTDRVQETSPGDRWDGAPGYFGGFHYNLRDVNGRTIPHPPVTFGRTTFTTGAYLSPRSYGYADSQAVYGPDNKRDIRARYFNFKVDQEIQRNWFVQLAGSYSLSRDHRPTTMGNTYNMSYSGYTQNANGLNYTPGGRYFTVRGWSRTDNAQYTPVTDLRLSTVYKLDLPWMQQDITADAGYYHVGSAEGTYTSTLRSASGGVLNLPVYFDELTSAHTGIQRWLDTPGSRWLAGSPTKRVRVTNTGYSISAAGRYLNGKVRTIIGARTDETETQSYNGAWSDNTLTKGVYTPADKGKTSAVSPLYSISYAPTDKVTIFYTRGSSYKPSTSARQTLKLPIDKDNPYGKTLDPESGTGDEFGVKLDLFESRLAVTASVYEINRLNVTQLWDRLAVQQLFNDPTETRSFHTEGVAARSKGFDLEAVWNPSSQISLVAGYAYLDSVITKDFSRPENIGLRSLAYKHSGQFLIKHSMPDGKLKGLTAGMSTVIRGDLSVSEGSQEFKPIPAYVVVNPFLGYQWRLSNGNNMKVALNVTNIFNHEYMKNYARFGEPRSYVLSTSLKF